ncbi:MAG TPA: methylated-DNA--[protein]-cysteine S-methyltransferase [Microbacteriaceae bacterium]
MITIPAFPNDHLLRMHSPIGRIELLGDGTAITSLAIEKDGMLPHDHVPEQLDRLLVKTARQLGEYFAGTRRRFSVPVRAAGTPFQKSVWAKLADLGWGEVTSYGALGTATGHPAAGRAVGGAIRANPVPILVPCHRVLASGGKITGYSRGQGVTTKAWLLDHEGIIHSTRAPQGPVPYQTTSSSSPGTDRDKAMPAPAAHDSNESASA